MKDKKKLIIIILGALALIAVVGVVLYFVLHKCDGYIKHDEDYIISKESQYVILNNYDGYKSYIENDYEGRPISEESKLNLKEEDFNDAKYVIVYFNITGCHDTIEDKRYEYHEDYMTAYYDKGTMCGLCAPEIYYDVIKVDKNSNYKKVEVKSRLVKEEVCDPNVAYKPMIYIYPEEDINLTIKLGTPSLLTSTYPTYQNKWEVKVSKDGNIYDYRTNRNYYALYWEANDTTELKMNEGFVVSGSQTVKFLEEKLEYMGLNDREINEFIVYWISKIENNKYNYIYFRTLQEINDYMPLSFSKDPDTLIRVLVDFKPLDKYVSVKEQKLPKNRRNGYTVVEWGGVLHSKE